MKAMDCAACGIALNHCFNCDLPFDEIEDCPEELCQPGHLWYCEECGE